MQKNFLSAYKNNKLKIKNRLAEFKSIPEDAILKEFIFCLLTPQSRAQKCWEAVEELHPIQNLNESSISKILKTKTRFHNTKAKRIIENLKNWDEIKTFLKEPNPTHLRNELEKNVNGYGLKEASHFLRNIGRSENKIAILDRHILRNLKALSIIPDEKIKNKKHYLQMEQDFLKYSRKIKIPADELDLLWWSQENGEIFK